MARTPFILAALAPLVFSVASAAHAQGMRDRVWVSVNAGVQVAGESLSDRFEFEQYTETATVDADYETGAALAFDGGIGIRLWKGLGAAVSASRARREDLSRIDASIPHPFFDNRPRGISGELDGASRTETGVHAQVTYTANPAGAIRATFSGGPSFLNVEQEIVTDVEYLEIYPFDDAAFVSADTRRVKGSGVGFNVGVDVAWMFGRTLGIGGLLRYTRASLDLDVDNRTAPVKAGGLVTAAGLRVQF